jgi:hypothetical protein
LSFVGVEVKFVEKHRVDFFVKKTECPICGENEVVVRRGTYRFNPPSNVPGGEMQVSGASWEECLSCKEHFLDQKMEKALQKIRDERLNEARREKQMVVTEE